MILVFVCAWRTNFLRSSTFNLLFSEKYGLKKIGTAMHLCGGVSKSFYNYTIRAKKYTYVRTSFICSVLFTVCKHWDAVSNRLRKKEKKKKRNES